MSRWARVVLFLLIAGAAALGAAAAYQWLTWPDVAGLAEHPPTTTAFIDAYRARQRVAGRPTEVAWRWVPWSAISPALKRAVVSGEDMEFFFHHGFSTAEMKAALKATVEQGKPLRGASTITQQLAKNLWLTPSRNPWRKVKEALLTRSLERHLPKRRILELYLNVVEFGPGVYGAEAAARAYFDEPASALTDHEAAMLAAGLPRPRTWHPGHKSSAYLAYVSEIERRMDMATFIWRYIGETGPVLDSVPGLDSPANLDSLAKRDSVPKVDSLFGVDSLHRDSVSDSVP
jgi:monofunctional biosynthetic peptidoglycan transglycosylase